MPLLAHKLGPGEYDYLGWYIVYGYPSDGGPKTWLVINDLGTVTTRPNFIEAVEYADAHPLYCH